MIDDDDWNMSNEAHSCGILELGKKNPNKGFIVITKNPGAG